MLSKTDRRTVMLGSRFIDCVRLKSHRMMSNGGRTDRRTELLPLDAKAAAAGLDEQRSPLGLIPSLLLPSTEDLPFLRGVLFYAGQMVSLV